MRELDTTHSRGNARVELHFKAFEVRPRRADLHEVQAKPQGEHHLCEEGARGAAWLHKRSVPHSNRVEPRNLCRKP